jgi:hypothetical protein
MQVSVGDLVRYKHDKYQMGLVLKFDNSRATYVENHETGEKTQVANDNIFVAWQGKDRSWFVEAQYIEVKGEGRYGWQDIE